MDICKVGYSSALLYYIFILHQTTTLFSCHNPNALLYYTFILHQTTTPILAIIQECCVVLYLHSTSNHNTRQINVMPWYVVLYLHSTSDHNRISMPTLCVCSCIIPSFYIKPQPKENKDKTHIGCIIPSFYIKPQPFALLVSDWDSCIIPSFYIKPQPLWWHYDEIYCCIIPSFYIKPQPYMNTLKNIKGCIIPSFYIKPQLAARVGHGLAVVLYLHSTSNHNRRKRGEVQSRLYYTFILHQTTTV